MQDRLPKQIDPRRLTEEQAKLSGQLRLAEMSRLQSMLYHSKDRFVFCQLAFDKDAQDIATVIGSAEFIADLQCQRCLAPITLTIKAEFTLGIVSSEDAMDLLPEQYDPLLLTDNPLIELACIIEDELILSLPLVAKHTLEQCHTDMLANISPSIANDHSDCRTNNNPFSVLAKLKLDKN